MDHGAEQASRDTTRAGVARALAECDVYLDLGHHPGRDRIPREAALAGCVVVVANRGAAANDVDMPLAQQYKVDLPRSRGSVAELRRLLEATRSEIGRHRYAQRAYRRVVLGQEAQFRAEVDDLLAVMDEYWAARPGGWSAEVW